MANKQLHEVLYDLTQPRPRAGVASQCLTILDALRWREEDDDDDEETPLRPIFEHLRSLTDWEEWVHLGEVDSEPAMKIFGESA